MLWYGGAECPEIYLFVYLFSHSLRLFMKLLNSFNVKYEHFPIAVLELWHFVIWQIPIRFSEEFTV